jgi:hypothetical protein
MGRNDDSERRQSPVTDPDAGAWTSLEAWKSLPSEPDLARAFGYDLADWDIVTSPGHSDQLILLPEEQEALAENAFIIADEGDVCDLRTKK